MKKSLIKCLVLSLTLCVLLSATVAKATVNDTCGIDDMTVYYIKNIYNGKYLNVLNGVDANGTDVCTVAFNGTSAQKWKVKRNTDGSYTIQSIMSTNNRVLDISGSNVDIWTYNSSLSCQKFTLVRNTTMAYGGTYNIMNGSNYVVVNAATDSAIKSSTGSGLNALWSFEPVNKGSAEIFTTYYQEGAFLLIFPDYYDTTGAVSTFISKCSSMGYTSTNYTNSSASSAYNCLKNDSIWVFRGHGLVDTNNVPLATICFLDNNGGNNGHITADSSIHNDYIDRAINLLSTNALSKERCVLYIGCSTGCDYSGYNLISSTFNKGAHFALGTTQEILTSDGTNWTKKFFEKADTGATIRQCIDYANYNTNLGLLYYEGDVYAKLK